MTSPNSEEISIAESIISLGFSDNAAFKAQEMLVSMPNWDSQFLTGQTKAKIKRENKTTVATGLPDMDIDNKPGKQRGDQGKQKRQSSEALFPVSVPKGNPQQGPRSRSDLTGLRMFEETKQEACRPKPQPRSPEQRQSTQQAQQAAQQQGQTFDNMPQKQVQEMGKQGGQAERKKQPPICPS